MYLSSDYIFSQELEHSNTHSEWTDFRAYFWPNKYEIMGNREIIFLKMDQSSATFFFGYTCSTKSESKVNSDCMTAYFFKMTFQIKLKLLNST